MWGNEAQMVLVLSRVTSEYRVGIPLPSLISHQGPRPLFSRHRVPEPSPWTPVGAGLRSLEGLRDPLAEPAVALGWKELCQAWVFFS